MCEAARVRRRDAEVAAARLRPAPHPLAVRTFDCRSSAPDARPPACRPRPPPRAAVPRRRLGRGATCRRAGNVCRRALIELRTASLHLSRDQSR
ncbi:hypothetical protein EVAR_45563_1 [Eumeta japonica]|uniref:Uncharacterized protein n=1 Tax=Eumeta variegata TaxID=151549 RepID=A0A4C1X878_EUMVA|nr:hypothetical protein EVAR_45563_1 [Eumeta japonica]